MFGRVRYSLLCSICPRKVPEVLRDRLRASIEIPVIPKRAQSAAAAAVAAGCGGCVLLWHVNH